MYSMKAVAELTGITPDTIRAWEKRHHAISPSRESNGRRQYNGNHVSRLRLLRQATKLGHPISKIAKMSETNLQVLIEEKHDDAELNKVSALTDKLVGAIQNYETSICDEILGLAATGMPPIEYCQKLLGPTLVEVGNLWETGKINSAQEHLLTTSIKRHLFSLIQVYQRQSTGPKLMFTTLNQDPHELGILMCCLVAAGQRFQCLYFGPGIPYNDMGHAIARISPKVLVLGTVQKLKCSTLMEELTHLCNYIPNQSEIWIGGSGTVHIDTETLSKKCRLLATFDEFSEQLSYLKIVNSAQHR